MNNREAFRRNLNYYLSTSGKLQKDLAEYVGAKTTTVSGWTRGISYPRADAMEKIAMFFGIPTSKLVGSDDETQTSAGGVYEEPKSDDIRLLIRGFNKLSPEQVATAKQVMKAMFAEYSEYFDSEKESDE